MPSKQRIGLTGGPSSQQVPSEFVLPPPYQPPPAPSPELLAIMTSDGSSGYTHDDYTPALYSIFPTTHNDVWVRIVFRHDLVMGYTAWPVFVLGFHEWILDQAYYGDWWRTGGFAGTTENNQFRTTFTKWNIGNGINIAPYNAFNQYGPSPSMPVVAATYDFHATYTGFQYFGTPYNRNAATYIYEAYKDGVKRVDGQSAIYADPSKALFTGFDAVVFFNQYASTGAQIQADGHGYLYVDSIDVGTTQGGSDILHEDFSSEWGNFSLDLGAMESMTESFHIVAEPGA